MPFKKGKSPDDVTAKYATIIDGITVKSTNEALTKALVYGAGASKEIAPIEFGNLVNSQYRYIEKTPTGFRGFVGYSVNYALFLEDPRKGGRLDGWQPRPPEDKEGPAWNPIASQGFLRLGFTGLESGPMITKILTDGITKK